MGKTWRLTRSIGVDVGIHYSPTAGDVVILATVYYSSLSSHFPLHVSP